MWRAQHPPGSHSKFMGQSLSPPHVFPPTDKLPTPPDTRLQVDRLLA